MSTRTQLLRQQSVSRADSTEVRKQSTVLKRIHRIEMIVIVQLRALPKHDLYM